MPAAKKPATKTPKVTKPEVENTEETVVSTEENVPKRYYIQIFLEKIPVDEHVGTIYFADKTGKIEIEYLDGRFASQIENLIEGDLLLNNGKFISIQENPKEWVLQAENATLGFNLFAKFLMETIEIAEDEE